MLYRLTHCSCFIYVVVLFFFFFFFFSSRRRHTRFDCDWSSDVCSSDLYAAAARFGRPDFAARAARAARWEIAIQLPTGAVRGGVIGEPESPAVFNTGQVLLGWLAAFEETGDGSFAEAACRAARYLVAMLDADGHWRRGNSRFARPDATLYNTRTAWALAEAGARLRGEAFSNAAAHSPRSGERRVGKEGRSPWSA